MQSRRHEVVARAFRGRGGKYRRLELEEALPLHPSPDRIDDGAARHDVAVQPLTPQIEEAIPKANVLGIVQLTEHLHRHSPAGPSTSISFTYTSTAPVGSSGLSVPAGRLRTLPSIRTTHSERSFSACLNAG